MPGERLGFIGILIAFLHADHVDIGGIGAFDQQGVLYGIQARLQGVVVVDDGVVHILLDFGNQSGFHFNQFDVHDGGFDVALGGFQAGAFLQGQDSLALQQQEGASFIGGVVGNRDRNRIGQGSRQGQGQGQGNQFLPGPGFPVPECS